MKKKVPLQIQEKKRFWTRKKRFPGLRDPEMILWETKKIPKKVPPKYPQNPIFRALRALFSLFRALRGPFFTFSGPAGPFPHFSGPAGLLDHFFGPCGAFCPIFRALRGLWSKFSGPAGPRSWPGPLGWGPGSPRKKAFEKKKVLGLRPDPEKKSSLATFFFHRLEIIN